VRGTELARVNAVRNFSPVSVFFGEPEQFNLWLFRGMTDANETAQDRGARERVEKCIEAMSASARHKGLARELLKLLDRRSDESQAKSKADRTIDI
jgi:hypothetical protein